MGLRWLAALGVAGTMLLTPSPTPPSADPSPSPSTSTLPPGPWGARADTLLARALAASPAGATASNYAAVAEAIALRHGWLDPRVATYLAQVMAMRLPDGGWGLTAPWDAFQDGSTNASTTTYTVSLVGVGDVLLAGYRAGVVDGAVITSVLSRLYTIPRIPVTGGYCLAYSAAAADVQAGYCVHNVSAGAAAFLVRAQAAGLPPALWWQSQLARYEVATYNPDARDWKYMDGRAHYNDPAHTGYSVASLHALAPAVAREATAYHLGRNLSNDNDVWLHLALAPFACAQAAQWLSEIDTEFGKPSNSTFGLLVQAAQLTARTAAACEPLGGP